MARLLTFLSVSVFVLVACMSSAAQDGTTDAFPNGTAQGGSLLAARLHVQELKASGEVLELTEDCNSACTVYLELGPEQLTIDPSISFGFHSATDWNQVSRETTELMVRYYPKAIQNWFWATVWGRPNNDLVYLPGTLIIQNGWARSLE